MIRMKFLEPLHITFVCKDIVSIFKTFLILLIISGENVMASKDLLLAPCQMKPLSWKACLIWPLDYWFLY